MSQAPESCWRLNNISHTINVRVPVPGFAAVVYMLPFTARHVVRQLHEQV
jgi:hypothetical protein